MQGLNFKTILRYTLILLFVVWGSNKFFLLYSYKTYSEEEIEALFKSVKSKYDIQIVYEIDGNFLSPLKNPPIPAGPAGDSEVKPIRHRVLIRYPELLIEALDKYPVAVIKNHLKAIHFAGEIDQHGFTAGGSYDPFRKILFIVDNGWQDKDKPIKTIHHELSSLFLKSTSFFLNPWIENNPKNYKYSYEVTNDTLKTFKNASLDGTDEDFEKGFMNTYGQTNFENDFNEYSAMIFTYPQKFKQIMDIYPRVRAKFLVWLEFYQKVDPVFTEKYLFGNT